MMSDANPTINNYSRENIILPEVGLHSLFYGLKTYQRSYIKRSV